MLHKILKTAAPVLALAFVAGLAGCNGKISVNGNEGVPLSELDLTGNAPTELVLAGPDTVIVTKGDKLSIDVEGDAEVSGAMRFTLDDEALRAFLFSKLAAYKVPATIQFSRDPLPRLGTGKIDRVALKQQFTA